MKFVILDHQPPENSVNQAQAARTEQPHFDLMFERAGKESLRTFATVAELLPEPEAKLDVLPLDDHRNEYLTYEGAVSNNRGVVTRHAQGTWTGDLDEEANLSFDHDSKHFAGQTWKIRFDSVKNVLFRIA